MGEPPRPLKDLEPQDLAEALVTLARRARGQFDNGGAVELAETLAQVREAADDVSGPSLYLLEVAEAFLRTLARSDLGKTELALRRFAGRDGDARVAILERLAAGRSVKLEETGELRSELEVMAEVGALRKRPDASFDLRPSLRSVALDLVEPEPFRVWRLVNKARNGAALARLSTAKAEQCVAAELGVTVQEAHQHFGRHPLNADASNVAPPSEVPRWTTRYTRPLTALRAHVVDEGALREAELRSNRDQQEGVVARLAGSASLASTISQSRPWDMQEGVAVRPLGSEPMASSSSQGTPSYGARRSTEMMSWSTQSEAS